MNRIVRQSDAEAIADALGYIAPRIRERVGNVDVLTRTDPNFAGLHRYPSSAVGRYNALGHAVYPCHQLHRPAAQRRDTVVLPTAVFAHHPARVRATIVHEFGHMLHERLRFEPIPVAITKYAETNGHEAFAEAFMAWSIGPSLTFDRSRDPVIDVLHERDPRTVALFESLT